MPQHQYLEGDSGSRHRAPRGRSLRGAAVGALLLLATFQSAALAGTPAPLEYAVKATYLYKFAPFVTWPPAAMQKSTFDLCLSGSDEVTKLVPEAAAGQQVNGKPLAIRTLAPGESPDSCQVLYIANSPAAPQLLDAVRAKPVLTITDAALQNHGIIGFTIVDHHVRFDIDNSQAASAGLAISSKLLSLANAVTPTQGATK